MVRANHETPFDVGVEAAVSETSLHEVPVVCATRRKQVFQGMLLASDKAVRVSVVRN